MVTSVCMHACVRMSKRVRCVRAYVCVYYCNIVYNDMGHSGLFQL